MFESGEIFVFGETTSKLVVFGAQLRVFRFERREVFGLALPRASSAERVLKPFPFDRSDEVVRHVVVVVSSSGALL